MKIQKLIEEEIEFLNYLLEIECFSNSKIELRIKQLENILAKEEKQNGK